MSDIGEKKRESSHVLQIRLIVVLSLLLHFSSLFFFAMPQSTQWPTASLTLTHYLHVTYINCVCMPRKHSVFKANYFLQSTSSQRWLCHFSLQRLETLPWSLEKSLASGFLVASLLFVVAFLMRNTCLGCSFYSDQIFPNKYEKVPCGWHQFLVTPSPMQSNTEAVFKGAPSRSSHLDWCPKLVKRLQKNSPSHPLVWKTCGL